MLFFMRIMFGSCLKSLSARYTSQSAGDFTRMRASQRATSAEFGHQKKTLHFKRHPVLPNRMPPSSMVSFYLLPYLSGSLFISSLRHTVNRYHYHCFPSPASGFRFLPDRPVYRCRNQMSGCLYFLQVLQLLSLLCNLFHPELLQ